MPVTPFDPYDPAVIACPWAHDAQLRQTLPVTYDFRNDIYVVANYELIYQIIQDQARFSSRYMEKMVSKTPFPPEVLEIYRGGYPIVDALLNTDGEQHDRHRKIITKAFSGKRLRELTPLFQQRIDKLLARILPQGEMYFREDFAEEVPTIMTQHQLRIPDEDMTQVLIWSRILSSGFGGSEKPVSVMKDEARQIVAFQHYFEGRVRFEMDRIARGEIERDDDLLTMLAQAVLDPAEPMDMVEAISFLFNLLPATHDTTTAALTACMHRLVMHPEAQRRAATEPGFIKQFVDEALRHESPIRNYWRRAVEDAEVGGVTIPAGAWVLMRISSANRDDAVFEEAARFDPDRGHKRPHLTFGSGIHTCAGRQYARHIIITSLESLVATAHDFAFVAGENDFDHDINLLSSPYSELVISFREGALAGAEASAG